MAGHAGPPVGPASDVVLPLHSLKCEEERCDLIGGTGGEGEGKVGPGREGLMALASAGCEMPSSSYTAGPRVARAVGCRIGVCGVYAGSAA